MASAIDDNLLDAIVAGVLGRLREAAAPVTASAGRQPPEAKTENAPKTRSADAPRSPEPLRLPDRVLTQAILEAKLNGAQAVRFAPKAVLTPTARDFLRTRGIDWAYGTAAEPTSTAAAWAAIVVRHAPGVDQALQDHLPGARRELLGCPDDAAKLAIAEIARGGFAKALIFAGQTHRAACLANRHPAVKAVAVRDAAEVAAVRTQLRANVWCVDPGGRGRFELKNLVKAIAVS